MFSEIQYPSSRHASQPLAIPYLRKSFIKDARSKEPSEARQLGEIRRWCERHSFALDEDRIIKDMEVGHQSGHDERRAGWGKIVEMVGGLQPGDAMVAESSARFARNVVLMVELAMLCHEYEVNLVMAAQSFIAPHPTRQPDEWSMFQQQVIRDEWERNKASWRITRTIAQMKEDGKWWGIPPAGTERTEDGLLVPSLAGCWWHPERREWKHLHTVTDARGNEKQVTIEDAEPATRPGAEWEWRGYHAASRRRFELLRDNGLSTTARLLNEAGWPFYSYREKRPRKWQKSDVRNGVYQWPIYAGHLTSGANMDHDPEIVQRDVWQPIHDRTLLRDAVAAVQARGSRQSSRSREYVYQVSGLLECVHCGAPIYGCTRSSYRELQDGTRKQYRYYTYRHLSEDPEAGCASYARLDADEVETAVRDVVAGLEVPAAMQEAVTEEATGTDVETQALRDELREILTRRDRLVDIYLDDTISKEEYTRRRAKMEDRIDALKAALRAKHGGVGERIEVVLLLDRLDVVLVESTPAETRALYAELFARIVIDMETTAFTIEPRPWLRERFGIDTIGPIRIRDPGPLQDVDIPDDVDDAGARRWLLAYFHDGVLVCPRCGADDAWHHSKASTTGLDSYRCRQCDKVYNLYGGTVLAGRLVTPVQALVLMRGFRDGEPAKRVAETVDLAYNTVRSIWARFEELL